MIVIGSYAAELNGIPLRTTIKDIDIYGSPADLERFRAENRDRIEDEKLAHGHRQYLKIRNAGALQKVEFDFGRAPSDLLLEDLGAGTARVLNSEVKLAPPNVLYLIKRAHANRPVHFDKTIDDLLALGRHVTEFTAAERRFYETLRVESDSKLAAQRPKFLVGVRGDDLLRSDSAVPIYIHSDVLSAIAEPPSPAHADRKGRVQIDETAFESLDPETRRRTMRELFMANGIERIYAFDRSVEAAQVYRQALLKTMRDLLPPRLQQFCFDNLAVLADAPDTGFLARFDAAVAAGRVGTLERQPPPLGPSHKKAWEMLKVGETTKARALCEDLVRFGELPGDPVALHILGLVYDRNGIKDLSEQCFRKSLFIRRQNPRAWSELGALLRRVGKNQEARQCFEEAIAQGTSSAEVFVELGLANEALDAPDSARAAYASALKLKPRLAAARDRLDALTVPVRP
jgi:hypothetical protein